MGHLLVIDFGDLHVDQVVMRRIVFVVAYLPVDCPKYWDIISKFAVLDTPSSTLSGERVKLLVKNLQVLNEKAFSTDRALSLELQSMNYDKCLPLGVVLVSSNHVCQVCSGKLLLHRDQPSRVMIYTETEGTLLGSHFVKFCQNYRRGCNYTQHYGYHTLGDQAVSHYDKNWSELQYYYLYLPAKRHLSFSFYRDLILKF